MKQIKDFLAFLRVRGLCLSRFAGRSKHSFLQNLSGKQFLAFGAETYAAQNALSYLNLGNRQA